MITKNIEKAADYTTKREMIAEQQLTEFVEYMRDTHGITLSFAAICYLRSSFTIAACDGFELGCDATEEQSR